MNKPNLADFMGNGPKRPTGMQIDISAQCQICHVSVDEAEYFHIEKLLKWVCPDGHVSFIEEFKL